MKTLLSGLVILLAGTAAEAREYECIGLDEAPDSNPRLRFQIDIDYQKIGTWAGNEVYLKEEEGSTYLMLHKNGESTVMISKKPEIGMLYKAKPGHLEVTHALFCDVTMKGPEENK